MHDRRRRRGRGWVGASLAALLLVLAWPVSSAEFAGGGFAVFGSTGQLSTAEQQRLSRGGTVVRTIERADAELGVFAATRFTGTAASLIGWTRAIAELKKAPGIRAVGRLSRVPTMRDLDGLVIDDDDLQALRRCIPGDCALKLDAPAIAAAHEAILRAGDSWRAAAIRAFKDILLTRVRQHREGGLGGLAPVVDKAAPTHAADTFRTLMVGWADPAQAVPSLSGTFGVSAPVDRPEVESFYYWSKERYDAGKDVISVTYVVMTAPRASSGIAALVLSQQIFASHYVNGAIGVTAVLQDAATGQRYLAYLNRSSVDLFTGPFRLFRRAAEQRIERQVPALLKQLRERLEQPPPS